MKPLPLDALKVFVTLCQTSSLTAASEKLHRAPSTLSHALKKLENHLGARLISRMGPRLQLTPAGQALFHQGEMLLAQAHQTERFIQAINQGWEACLRIAVDEIMPINPVLKLCEAFYAHAPPGTELQLTREVLGGGWDALATGRTELVLGAPDPVPEEISGLRSQLIGKIEMKLAVPTHHPLASASQPITREEISRYRAVAIADSSQALAPRSAGLTPNQPVFTVASLQQKLAAQKAGIGIGYLPSHLLTEADTSKTLVCPPTADPPICPRLYAAWRTPAAGCGLLWFIQALEKCSPQDFGLQPA